jgi:hypothetical protein
MRKTLLAMLLIFSAAACREAPDTPEETYYAFYEALTERDWDAAVRYLSSDALDAFRGVGGRLKRFIGSEKDPLTVFLRGATADAIRPLRRVEVISREEGRAVLKVTAGPCGEGENCHVSQVSLRKEDNRWVICPQLPSLFKKGEDQ